MLVHAEMLCNSSGAFASLALLFPQPSYIATYCLASSTLMFHVD